MIPGNPNESYSEGSVGAFEDGHAEEPKTKRTRNRRPASCESCRKKKMRCDRLLPCDTCKARGEEDQCSYGEGSAPLHLPPSTSESIELKHQVDRLQALVDALSRNAAKSSNQDLEVPKKKAKAGSVRQPHDDGSPGSSSPVNGGTDSENNVRDLNLKSLDICEALGQLSVSGILRIDAQPQSRAPLIPEARASLGGSPPPSQTNTLGSFPFSSTPDSIEKIMAILPTVGQAETVIRCFAHQLSWYIQVFPWSDFNLQWATLKKATTADADCSFLGVFLAVCGLGLNFLPDKHAGEFPAGDGKKAMVKQWLDASASALTLARFLDRPSLNTIHTMQLLAAWHIYLSSGDTSSTGFAILNIAAEATLQLGLQRDPDPHQYTPFESNVRRATFWWTVTLEALATTSLGKTWSLFQLQHCDTELPLAVDEEAFTREGYLRPDYVPTTEPNMVSVLLRMRIAVVSKQISDKAFSIQNVSFSTVLELDRDLHKLENSFPAHLKIGFEKGQLTFAPNISKITRMRAYMVNISLLQEYMRLHRPFVASGDTFATSRIACLRASRMAIAIYKDLAQMNYGGLTFKAISSCTVLCMDLISNPTSGDAAAMRRDVVETIDLLEGNMKYSSMATNGSKLLRFLLQKSSPLPVFSAGSQSVGAQNLKRMYDTAGTDSARGSETSVSPSETHASQSYIPRQFVSMRNVTAPPMQFSTSPGVPLPSATLNAHAMPFAAHSPTLACPPGQQSQPTSPLYSTPYVQPAIPQSSPYTPSYFSYLGSTATGLKQDLDVSDSMYHAATQVSSGPSSSLGSGSRFPATPDLGGSGPSHFYNNKIAPEYMQASLATASGYQDYHEALQAMMGSVGAGTAQGWA